MTSKNKQTDFVVFILSHGRADKVITYKTLRKLGYTGKVYLVVDTDDTTVEKYQANFGTENVLLFDKAEVAKTTDVGDNRKDYNGVLWARNVSFKLAKDLGIKYFLALDDDYNNFSYKYNEQMVYHERSIKNLDKVFEAMLTFYKSIPATSIATAQNGDFIGGKNSGTAKNGKLLRKCMNSFFCSTDRPFQFMGRINEDVTAYTLLGSQGHLFFTVPLISLNQLQTQSNSGGLTELYIASGTYVKSFYTVMYSPSCCKIGLMGDKDMRLHHSIKWNNAVPKIISEVHKKT